MEVYFLGVVRVELGANSFGLSCAQNRQYDALGTGPALHLLGGSLSQ